MYKITDTYQTQMYTMEIITLEINGEKKDTLVTFHYGKSDGIYYSNKWGEKREDLNDHETEELLNWLYENHFFSPVE